MSTLSASFAQETPKEINNDLLKLQRMREREDNYFDSAYAFIQKKLRIDTKWILYQSDSYRINQAWANHAIWNNCMANLLASYLEENHYAITSRTPIEGERPADINTWDTQTIVEAILEYYHNSLVSKIILQNIPLGDYGDLLKMGTDQKDYEPTLYDFLVHDFLAFLKQRSWELPQPLTPFHCDQPELLVDNVTFTNLHLSSTDSLSFEYQSLLQYQELTRFHLQSGHTKALAVITCERLQYAFEHCAIGNKEELLINTLEQMAQAWTGKAGYEDICYALANRYYQRADLYDRDTHPEGFDDNKTAIEWCNKAIQAASNSIAANNAKLLKASIQQPSVTFYNASHLLPNQPNLITYEYKNCNKLYCRIIPFKTPISVGKQNYNDLISKHFIKEWTVNARTHDDYRTVVQPDVLPALPIGSYVLLVSPTPFSSSNAEGISSDWFQVTDLDYTSRYNDSEHYAEFLFFRRSTGEPLAHRSVTTWYTRNSKDKTGVTTRKTDERGMVRIPARKDFEIVCKLAEGQDAITADEWHWWRELDEDVDDDNNATTRMHYFTDRAIYRPGQTVHFKCIMVKSSYKNNHTVADKEVEIILCDANWKEIDKQTLITNHYGSVSGEFQLPENTRTGNFTIFCKGLGSHSFRVEEYKRPQFEVTIEKPTDTYRIGDEINMVGKAMAYAGYPIDGATVRYRVVRMASYPYWKWWWRPLPSSPGQEIAQGETTTDANGQFTFTFTASANPTDNPAYAPVYHYQMSATVTDLNGETHHENATVCVGQKNLLLDLDLPQQICADEAASSYSLKATNLSGVPQQVDVAYRIERLATPAVFKHNRPYNTRPDGDLFDLTQVEQQIPYFELDNEAHPEAWTTLEEVCHVLLNTQDADRIEIPNLSHYKDGYYKLTLSAKDKDGQEVTKEKIFFVFHQKNKKCTAYEPVWLYCDKSTAEVGETVTIYVGSYLDNAHIFLEMSNNDTLLKSEWLTLKQGVTKFTLPIKESHRGAITLKAITCHQGVHCAKSLTLQVPFTNKQIETTFETFRDLAYPGADEEWRITLKGKNGDAIAAELLCAMYDASLDVFAQNSFRLPIDHLNLRQVFPLFNLYYDAFSKSSFSNFNTIKPYKSYIYAEYKNGLTYYSPYLIGSSKSRRVYATAFAFNDAVDINMDMEVEEEALDAPASFAQKEVVLNMVEDNIKVETDLDFSADNTTSTGAGATAEPDVQIRSNFAETAFFYPHLSTNENGEVVIKCKLPESLTQWKMLGLAHTTDLKTGFFEKLLRTRKELMVVPNVPRFFREGDTIWFTAKVVSTDESAQRLSGQVTLTLTDAMTGKPLNIIDNSATQPFTILNGESALVRFQLHIPQQLSAITYRIVATCNETPFSDGQEATLPVLANRMMVTETLPFYVNGKQDKTITFNALKDACQQIDKPGNTLAHHKLTLEFTNNPVWYALGSLPYMIEYPYECNEQIFSRLYGNALATHIANSSPAIQQVFNEWQKSAPNAFYSNLDKNAELKNIVLEESPWVMDAENESAQRQRMGQLFDTQRMAKELKNAIDKLEKNQKSSGAWPWFAGGYDSPFITQHIVAGFGHLNVLGVKTSIKSSTLTKAVRYLDLEADKEYREMKKNGTADYLGSIQLHYLYARSFFLKGYPVNSGCTEAYQHYLSLARKNYEKMSFYDQALTALILYRNGETALAQKVVARLKEYAQYSDEMGMWWKKQGYGFFWNEAPIERQALLIEAFNTVANDKESVEKMQTWLLKQKQTQNWGTTKATAEACYALLLNNDLAAQLKESEDPNIQTTFSYGDVVLKPTAPLTAEAATGYFKTSWDNQQIGEQNATLTVSKPTAGIAWGGLYWQYFENLDKIKQDKSLPHPLSLSKQLYKVVLNERGETLQAISEQTPLKVGDKVRVRIELRSDRDMEYVHLKDMRCAGFELTNNMSGYRYQDGLFYYEAPRDAAVNFFFDRLPKGTYVFEYTLIAEQAGTFSNGISTVQCMYAPEFADHSAGVTVRIKEGD